MRLHYSGMFGKFGVYVIEPGLIIVACRRFHFAVQSKKLFGALIGFGDCAIGFSFGFPSCEEGRQEFIIRFLASRDKRVIIEVEAIR